MSPIVKFAFLTSSLFLATGCVIHTGNFSSQSADVHMEKKLTLDAEHLKSFDIEAGAGSLSIVGVDGQNDIQVDAEILTSKDRNFTLTLEKSGNEAQLVAEHHSHIGFWIGSSPRINLVITMPKHLALDIDDGSGDIEIRDINNNIVLDDGSGSTTLTSIKGDVRIDDGSGDLTAQNIHGSVYLDDGSGELTIANIIGDVEVVDGSGDLSVESATGLVTIDDGSGDIEVNTAGSLKIIDSGSGDLDINNIKSGVEIQS